MQINKPLIVYRPDTRGVVMSRFGRGNMKIGPGVYTYSRLPGSDKRIALGMAFQVGATTGTCPGSSPECEAICYARRPVEEAGTVLDMWKDNSIREDVPELPEDAKLVRLHVSGDFDSVDYIHEWFMRMLERPDVTMWAYTRSWRVPELLDALEDLRGLPNVQLFASMDQSISEMPPAGWRRAWIDGDPRQGDTHQIMAHTPLAEGMTSFELQQTADGVKALICPEETKHTPNCETCGFCFKGQRNDVVFLKH